jgi:hypothetical protein
MWLVRQLAVNEEMTRLSIVWFALVEALTSSPRMIR